MLQVTTKLVIIMENVQLVAHKIVVQVCIYLDVEVIPLDHVHYVHRVQPINTEVVVWV